MCVMHSVISMWMLDWGSAGAGLWCGIGSTYAGHKISQTVSQQKPKALARESKADAPVGLCKVSPKQFGKLGSSSFLSSDADKIPELREMGFVLLAHPSLPAWGTALHPPENVAKCPSNASSFLPQSPGPWPRSPGGWMACWTQAQLSVRAL